MRRFTWFAVAVILLAAYTASSAQFLFQRQVVQAAKFLLIGQLSSSQLATLKTDILADANLVKTLKEVSGGDAIVAAAYNAPASPDFWVWRSKVTKAEFTGSTSIDGTTFNWTGAGFITRAQGERDAWRELFDADGSVNPSLTNVRQAFADIFSGGTAPAPANRTHLLAVARRKASRIEKLFATGTGSTGSPGTLVFEGTVTPSEILAAYTLP